MWRKRDSVLVDLYKAHSQEEPSLHSNCCSGSCYNPSYLPQPPPLTKTTKNPRSIYPGSDFDVFGKDKSPQTFTEIYSIEPFISKQLTSCPQKEEIVIAHGFKRGQLEALLDSTAIIKKRKVNTDMMTHNTQSVFFKSTAAYNTPSNIFMTHNNEHWEDSIDLEYC
ncbi:unnamed protein product [Rhizopus microsporus]